MNKYSWDAYLTDEQMAYLAVVRNGIDTTTVSAVSAFNASWHMVRILGHVVIVTFGTLRNKKEEVYEEEEESRRDD